MNDSRSWRPFAMISLALIMGTVGTALSSPLYPIYEAQWLLLPSQITYIFVAYMFGCLATLLFFGRASNSFGFLRTLQAGLVFVIAGLTLSALAPNALFLSIARFLIGIASGLISTSAMLGLIYTIPDSHKQNAPQFSSIITVIGFGLGPFIGGLIAQFSHHPLFTPYLPVIAGAALCLIGLFSLKSQNIDRQPFSIAPHLQLPAPQHNQQFYCASLTAFSAFASFSLFASLAPSFVKDIIPWHGPLVSGSAIASILLVSALSQFFSKAAAPQKALTAGLICLICSFIFLSASLHLASALFFISVVAAGMGHGLGLIGAFGLIHGMTQTENRAAVMSTYLFIAYLGTIVPIIGAGYLSDHFGFAAGIWGFCLVLGLLCAGLLLHQRRINKKRHFK